MGLLRKGLGLRRIQSGETEIQVSMIGRVIRLQFDLLPEHANLVDNVVPVSGCFEFLGE